MRCTRFDGELGYRCTQRSYFGLLVASSPAALLPESVGPIVAGPVGEASEVGVIVTTALHATADGELSAVGKSSTPSTKVFGASTGRGSAKN